MNIKKGLPKSQTKTPMSFSDCQITDTVSEWVLKKAEDIEAWGALLAIIIIVLGVISAFGSANVVEVRDSYRYGISEETAFSFSIFFASMAQTALYAFVTFVVYKAIVVIIVALAAVVHNTKVTADTSLYHIAISIEEDKDLSTNAQKMQNKKPVVSKDWTCPSCGALNDTNSVSCKDCGNYR